jgi:hypothetical protein
MKKLAILVLLSTTIGTALAIGQAKTAVAVKTVKPPVIDGIIQENEWQNAYWQNSFVACPGDALTKQQTRFAVIFDKNNIYLAAKCDEIHINKIKPYSKNDINIWRHDGLEFFLQRLSNNKEYSQFLVSAGGGRYGLKFTTTTSRTNQAIASSKWQAAAALNSGGYTIEIKIPFSLFSDANPQNGTEWRLNIQRNSTTLDSDRYSTWSPVSKFQNPADFGYLVFALAEPQLLQRRITMKRKFNQLKSQIESFNDKYAKFDPVFAGKIKTKLKQLDWVQFKRQATQIMQMNSTQLIKFSEGLKKLSICMEQLKKMRAEYLLNKLFM